VCSSDLFKIAGGNIPTTLPPSLLSSLKLGVGSGPSVGVTPSQPPITIPEITLPDISISISIPSIPQFDISPMNPYPISELADKFGVSDVIMSVYEPYNDIQRTQSEVQTSAVAQQVLDQAEPELKNLNLKLDSLTVTQRSLQDKSLVLNSQLQLAENQRQQILSLFQDYNNQLEQVQHELKQQYQDLVSLKSNLESYGSMAVGDVNSVRLLRNQLSQEQNDLNSQSEMIREEKNRTLAEIDLIRKETERINEEISQLDTNSVSRTMASISLMGQQQQSDIHISQPMGNVYNSGFVVSPAFNVTPAFTVNQVPAEISEGYEVKGRERRKSRNVDNSVKFDRKDIQVADKLLKKEKDKKSKKKK